MTARRDFFRITAGLSALAVWPKFSFAELPPRFMDLAGTRPSSQQIIQALKAQQTISATKTRKLNLEPMLSAQPGAVADSTPRESIAVKSESPRLSFDQITFEFDSARISREAFPVLLEIGTALKSEELRGLRFLIEGHTDATGGLQYNMRLSARRADAVKRYLITRHNLRVNRLLTAGKGSTDLHDTENPTSGTNRRVVLMAFDGETAVT
jgi:outer membrane protein OmpA-like peptidoglycan-associated protein